MNKDILSLVFFLLNFAIVNGQVCEGNLGENIFSDGDFGSGASNILNPNPQIAPGYGYAFNPPPNDGNYTITNNTTNWGSFAGPNWSDITDNSDDPNGYMMVVNASYEPGLFYEQEVDGLCDNTLYSFSADVYNLADGIQPNISFLLDGVEVYNTGNIPRNEKWETFGFTFTTLPNQTSITLALQNNAPGGIGNDLALDNISFRACGPEALILPDQVANICEDGNPIDLDATILDSPYDTTYIQWQESLDGGFTWTDISGETSTSFPFTNLSGGMYYYRFVLANSAVNIQNQKCRIVSNIKIVNVVPKFYTIIDTLCEGLAFELKDQLYAETGVYVDSLLTYLGCDSIVTLDLTIVPDTEIDATFTTSDPACDYLANGSIGISSISNGALPLELYFNDEEQIDNDFFNLLAGDYDIQFLDRFGCVLDTVLSLEAPPPFIIDLGGDLTVNLGEAVTIEPFASLPVSNYTWQPPSISECEPDCETINFTPIASSELIVIANSEGDCIAADSIYVQVEEVREVYIPNAFSPNEDGINDVFTIFANEPNVQQIESLQIFDRWGQLLFQQNDFLPNSLNNGWNGRYKGKLVENGVYLFVAEIQFLDGETLIYTGDISLIQ